MSFVSPLFLAAGAAAAAGVLLLHLLAWRRPPAAPLPTARFVPERSLRTAARSLRPSDLVLLLIRVAIVMLVATALAGPIVTPRRSGSAEVVVVDRSRAVADVADATARARERLEGGDVLVLMDSSARSVEEGAADSLATLKRVDAPGSLSAALVAAGRAARRLAERHDSVTIVLVSPIVEEEVDEATRSIRASWPGALVLERVAADRPDSVAPKLSVRAPADDALGAVVRLAGWEGSEASAVVRLVRESVAGTDSAWAREGNRVLVVWKTGTGDGTLRTAGARENGLVAGAATVVAPLLRTASPPPGRVVARWLDGTPAATETPHGMGCVRTVAVGVPEIGDVALAPSFRRVLGELTSACGGRARLATLDSAVVETLLVTPSPRGERFAPVTNRAGVAGSLDRRASVATWLLGAALALAIAELLVRDPRRRA